MKRVVFVANDQVWPTHTGGRTRMAGLVEALASEFDVVTLEPDVIDMPRSNVRRVHFEANNRPHAFSNSMTPKPRHGASLLRGGGGSSVARHVAELSADVLFLSHSYLAPWFLPAQVPVVVDFQNLEVERSRSFRSDGTVGRRASHLLEFLKARRWEPAVACGSNCAVAVDGANAEVLAAWGAPRVVIVPNATASDVAVAPSPSRPAVLFLANVGYAPNREAATWLQEEIWPLVRRSLTDATLTIAGRGSKELQASPAAGVYVLGEVADVAEVYRDAAVVVAPVRSGAGTQVKVAEALAHGRVVVATSFSSKSIPADAMAGCVIADSAEDFAAAVCELLLHADRRRTMEQLATVPHWQHAVAPLAAEIRRLVRERE